MELTVKAISDRLSQYPRRVCSLLLPAGREIKGEWCAGSIHGEAGESLKVHLDGQYPGHWQDWADDSQKGDLLDLWAAVKGILMPQAIREAKQFLGIADAAPACERKYAKAPKKDEIKPLNPAGKAMEYLCKKRGLEPSIVNRFCIVGDGKNLVFPCYSPTGTLINRSYRTLTPQKEVWQEKGCAPCLFGWHALDNSAYRERKILLCEGQIDAASWTQLGVNALSIPNGSGQTWIEYEWENMLAFDTIYLGFDMDGAGQDNAQKTIHRLGRHRCMLVSLPHKDANDCLLAGATPDDAKGWIASAKAPPMKNLVRAADLRERLLYELTPKEDPFTLPFLRNGKRGHGYFPRPSEVTVWTGASSQGKSTFLNFFIMACLVSGHPVLIASMESKAEVILRKMMTSFYNRIPDEARIDEFMGEVGHLLIIADVVGYIGQEQLLEMMRFSNRRYGVEHCVIDSLMRVDGLEEDYPAQGKFLNELQSVAKESTMHVHLVAHPRKMNDDAKPGKMDVKGSSLIPNNADNIVAVCRNYEKDKLRKDGKLTPEQNKALYDAEIRVEKQRETGWEGRFLLRFDPETFCYSPFST